jgi:hypothetical protein
MYGNMKDTLQTQNIRLQQAVRTGEARLEQQDKDLAIAREIQAGLIPSQIPQLDELRIAASWQPARAVGGDYFDVIKLGEQRIAVCIADVVGKGIAAALLMANVQAGVKAFAAENTHPSEMCERLNRVLCSNLAPGKFVTFFWCVIDTGARTLSYCNAGHCLPLLSRATGKVEVCGEGGIVLGIFPDSIYETAIIQFEPGDKMLLFTDGITKNGANPTAAQNKFLIRFFFWSGLGKRFTSAVESKVAQDLLKMDRILKDETPEYGREDAVQLTAEDLKYHWFSTNDAFSKTILCILAYQQPKSFGSNAIVHLDNSWLKQINSKNYHHFFPRAFLSKQGVETGRQTLLLTSQSSMIS